MQRTVLFYACDLRLMYTKIQMITYETDKLEQGNKRIFFIYRNENKTAYF